MAPTNVGVPNQSLYCTNLPDKIKKPDLRLALYTLFSTYGIVLDVVAMKTAKMRGQAHIVFKDIQTSTQAMRALQGFNFFGKEMKIMYAKGSSDIIAKLRGTYAPPHTLEQSAISTDLQKSIFNMPPSAAAAPTPLAQTQNTEQKVSQAIQGVKRPREEESDQEENEDEAPMEESDVSMEASSDEE